MTQAWRRWPACLALLVLLGACGKRGSPLPPFSDLPAPVTDVTARRVGAQVVVRFAVPEANADGRRPANLDRVELYVHTARLRDPASYARLATFAGSMTVQPVPAQGSGSPDGAGSVNAESSETPEPMIGQGEEAALVDAVGLSLPPPEPEPALEDEEDEPEEAWLFPDGGGPLLSPPSMASRVYVLVGVNRRGRRGAVTELEVSFINAPSAPGRPHVTYTEETMTLSWLPPSIPLRRPIQQATRDDVDEGDEDEDEDADEAGADAVDEAGADAVDEAGADAVDEAGADAVDEAGADAVDAAGAEDEPPLVARTLVPFVASGGYNVYEVRGSTGVETANLAALVSLNSSLLTEPTFEDSRVEFGVERCFVARSQETHGSVTAESAASAVACVTPVDSFAPRAPETLGAVAGEGVISLLWDPNDEPDLAGYRVLRGEAPGEKLQALTTVPVQEATYRDTTVQPGVTYVYAVEAVDTAGNVGAQSNRVEESGR